jgi:hypothetical protein
MHFFDIMCNELVFVHLFLDFYACAILNELSFYTFRSIPVAVRCMTQSTAMAVDGVQSTAVVLMRISGGGWWGGKRQPRGATRHRICILFAVFCVLMLACINFCAHNGAVLCVFVFLCLGA